MRRLRRLTLVSGALLASAALLWFSSAADGRAELPNAAPPAPDLRDSARDFAAAPAHRLFPASHLRQLASNARDHRWHFPDRRAWPLHPDDTPIVRTKRLDRLAVPVDSARALEKLQEKYRTTDEELSRWNPRLDTDDFDQTRRVVLWQRDPAEHPVSVGEASRGRLEHGEPLPPSPDYEIIHRHRAFGTHYAVSEVRRVMSAYYRRYPDAHRLMIGDLSFRGGDRMYPHLSHQSGRDVDISYPRKQPPSNFRTFHWVDDNELATEKALFFLRTLLNGGYVRYIFTDFALQRELYELADKRGAPDAWLDRVFAYPDFGADGIVRHEPGHQDHMHVRFYCQRTDRDCGPD